jgi:hypothetical protein
MVISSVTYSCPFCMKPYKSKKSAEKCEASCKVKTQKEKERVESRNSLLNDLYTELTLKSTKEEFKEVLQKHIRKISKCPSFTIKTLNRYRITQGHYTTRLVLNIHMDFECSKDDVKGPNDFVSDKLRYINGIDSGSGGGGGNTYSGSFYLFLDKFITLKKDYEEYLLIKAEKDEYERQSGICNNKHLEEVGKRYSSNEMQFYFTNIIKELQKEIDENRQKLDDIFQTIKESTKNDYLVPEKYKYDEDKWKQFKHWTND